MCKTLPLARTLPSRVIPTSTNDSGSAKAKEIGKEERKRDREKRVYIARRDAGNYRKRGYGLSQFNKLHVKVTIKVPLGWEPVAA